MLQRLARAFRPAPPPVAEVARGASRPLYEGMSSAEYLAFIRARNVAREAEELGIRIEMIRTEQTRARIAAMKADITERETIRSSRFVTDTKKEK